MILDVTQPVLDYSGEPARTPDGKETTVRKMIFQALDSQLPSEVLSVDDKATAFRLLCQVMTKDKVDLTAEDATFIKRRSGVVNPPLPHGRICEAIEAAGNPTVDDSDE